MKENYWVREELSDESFRLQKREIKRQDNEPRINQQQQQRDDTYESRHRHKKERIDLPTIVTTSPPPQATKTSDLRKNKNHSSISLGHAEVSVNNNSSEEDEDEKEDVNQIGGKNRDDIQGDDEQWGEKFLDKDAPVSLKSQDKLQAKGQQPQVRKDENDVNLSFCGCGFLGIYHVGVASCFHQYAPQLSMHKISGSSAGALVAVAHICGNLQLAYATTDILRVAIEARARALGPLHPSFDINALVREALERGLPDDVHLRASGKLHISLTRVYDGENVVISEFESKEEVIQALLCSCFIPFWSGLVTPKFRGISYMDGGFSKNLLILDDKTVTVSPFAGEADICPKDDSLNLLQVSLSNTSFSLSPNNLYRLSHALMPPPPEVLSDLCEQGFADGIRFLQQMKLISCTKCLEIRSSLLVTTNGEDMEEAFTHQVNSDEFLRSTSSFSENHHHIRLEQQEQKMIEINGNQRRNSVVSTTSQIYQMNTSSASSQSYCPSTNISHPRDNNNRFSESDVEEVESCNECVLIRQKALYDPLPTQFSDRIRDACDAVNKSLSNWLYSYRPIKYLSYLAAPYYLPIDISLALILKCWQELPLIRSELLNCVSNIVNFLIGIVRRMHARSTSRLLMGPESGWEEECSAIKYEKEVIRLQKNTSKNGVNTNGSDGDNISSKCSTSCCPLDANNRHHCDGCISAQSHSQSSTITTSTKTVESSISVKITSDGMCVSKHMAPHMTNSNQQLHSLEDTFDSIVDVTSNQEARIFAYYFRDAKNRLQVTEIFDRDERAADLQHTTEGSSLSNTNSIHSTSNDNNNNNLGLFQRQPYVLRSLLDVVMVAKGYREKGETGSTPAVLE